MTNKILKSHKISKKTKASVAVVIIFDKDLQNHYRVVKNCIYIVAKYAKMYCSSTLRLTHSTCTLTLIFQPLVCWWTTWSDLCTESGCVFAWRCLLNQLTNVSQHISKVGLNSRRIPTDSIWSHGSGIFWNSTSNSLCTFPNNLLLIIEKFKQT